MNLSKYLMTILFLSFSVNIYAANSITSVTQESNKSYRKEILEKEQMRDVKSYQPKKETVPEKEEKAEDVTFFVSKIVLIGCKSFLPADFDFLTSKYENKKLTLKKLRRIAKKIKNEYIRKGIIAAVIVPPQEIKDQTAVLHIIEARMGLLGYNDHKFYNNSKIAYYWQLNQKDIIRYPLLSKSLHLINKNPDREAKATLKAGETPGTTDIDLIVKTGFPLHLSAGYDNLGTTATGANKYNLGFRHNNLLNLDDSIIVGKSFGHDFTGIYAYHTIPLNKKGTSFMYGYSYSKSFPKKEYTSSLVDSRARSTSFYLRQDLFNNKGYSGEAYAGFDLKDKATHTINGTSNKDRLRILRIGANFTLKKNAAFIYLNPELSQGINGFGALRKNSFSSRSAENTFTKFNLSLTYKKRLSSKLLGSIKIKTQFASEKLTPQEQMSMGGMSSVRGYPSSDYLADYGLITNTELSLPILKQKAKLIFFYDHAEGFKKGNITGEESKAQLGSIGTGINFNLFGAKIKLAWGFPVGERTRLQKSDSRFHLTINFLSKSKKK